MIRYDKYKKSPRYGDMIITDNGTSFLIIQSMFGGVTNTKNGVLLYEPEHYVIIHEVESLDLLRIGTTHEFGEIKIIIPREHIGIGVEEDEGE